MIEKCKSCGHALLPIQQGNSMFPFWACDNAECSVRHLSADSVRIPTQTNMSEPLKPCPLCGTEAERYETLARCHNTICPMRGSWIHHKEWNTRPVEDKLREALKRAHDALKPFATVEPRGIKCIPPELVWLWKPSSTSDNDPPGISMGHVLDAKQAFTSAESALKL